MSEHRAITPLLTAAAVVLAAAALAGCSQTTTTAVTTPASSAAQANPRADSGAKTLAQTAQTAAETYTTEHHGSYAGVSPETLQQIEPSLRPGTEDGGAYLSGATSLESGKGYEVTATATTGDTFTVSRKGNGEVAHTCAPAGKESCPEGGTSW
jgi:hypothetical protein